MASPKRNTPGVCRQCGASFLTWKFSVEQGNGLYCSRACHHESRRQRTPVSCERCGKTFFVAPARAKHRNPRFCSMGCKSGNYRADRFLNRNGYPVVLCADGKKRIEHRAVAEAKIGRPLRRGEHVHHINGDRTDNRPENLDVLSRSQHTSLHKRCSRWARKFDRCVECGESTRRHIAQGLCARCYCRKRSRVTHGISPEDYRV